MLLNVTLFGKQDTYNIGGKEETTIYELAKIIDYPMYMDIDLTNAFHQIPLHPETSARLSIQTP